ncbi:Hypothetical Protein FCC1311_009702 [Hondaea fermentalgiana]|uniref:Uncharacterized protein n=1 Tax=Hondaea fermentalgiana TaxID=2315210 RepID=A0A2R5G183_9STRA|nr:Hypothetical Protein FCC1311_009702 [Hondaea fermentalgiana]|eukprot:GBG24752.1 Hypothetical Protein FCC1311_009702 [Hondaea fermentalgiana]
MDNVKEVSVVLDGLIMWLQNAGDQERVVLCEHDVLTKLFALIMSSIASSPEPLAHASLTALKRQLGGLLDNLLRVTSGTLAASAGSLIDAASHLRGASDAVDAMANVAALAISQHATKASAPEVASRAGDVNVAPASISSLPEGEDVLTQLEQSLLPAVPRGDKLVVQTGGERLSPGEVGRLFRLRDTGKRAAEVAARCVEFAKAKSADATFEHTPDTDHLCDFVQQFHEEAQSTAQNASAAQSNLLAFAKAEQDAEGPDPESVRAAAKEELAALKTERAKLAAELARLDERIAASSSSLRALDEQISSDKASAEAQLETLRSQAKSAATLAQDAQQRLVAATRMQRFGADLSSVLRTCSAPATPANEVAQWTTRASLAMDRYLAVEAACTSFIRARMQGAEARITDFETKASNLNSIGMRTLADEAASRCEQERKHKAEDEATLEALKSAAQTLAASIPKLVDSDLPSSAVSALYRCKDHLEKIGLQIDLSSLPSASTSQESTSGKKTRPQPPPSSPLKIAQAAAPAAPKSSWSGWAKPQSKALGLSMREILAQESAGNLDAGAKDPKEPPVQTEEVASTSSGEVKPASSRTEAESGQLIKDDVKVNDDVLKHVNENDADVVASSDQAANTHSDGVSGEERPSKADDETSEFDAVAIASDAHANVESEEDADESEANVDAAANVEVSSADINNHADADPQTDATTADADADAESEADDVESEGNVDAAAHVEVSSADIKNDADADPQTDATIGDADADVESVADAADNVESEGNVDAAGNVEVFSADAEPSTGTSAENVEADADKDDGVDISPDADPESIACKQEPPVASNHGKADILSDNLDESSANALAADANGIESASVETECDREDEQKPSSETELDQDASGIDDATAADQSEEVSSAKAAGGGIRDEAGREETPETPSRDESESEKENNQAGVVSAVGTSEKDHDGESKSDSLVGKREEGPADDEEGPAEDLEPKQGGVPRRGVSRGDEEEEDVDLD